MSTFPASGCPDASVTRTEYGQGRFTRGAWFGARSTAWTAPDDADAPPPLVAAGAELVPVVLDTLDELDDELLPQAEIVKAMDTASAAWALSQRMSRS